MRERNEPQEHTVIARIGDDPAALTRVVSLLRRRGFGLHSMSVGPCEGDAGRRATFVVYAPDVRQLMAQLGRLVDVLDARALTTERVGVHAASA